MRTIDGIILVLCAAASYLTPAWGADTVRTSDHESIQAAVNAHPGAAILIDADAVIDGPIEIRSDNTRLFGGAHITQSNPGAELLHIISAQGVRVSGLTLSRAPGKEESTCHAIHAENCIDLDIDAICVRENRSPAGTICLEQCQSSRVRDCSVINYKRVCVDDRTANELYGYAFRVIDGTGILVTQGKHIQIIGNQIIERHLVPDPVTKTRFQLGEFTEGSRPTKPGRLAPRGTYANNWHQGSAVVITAPEDTSHVLIEGNMIENAAQGIDIHADHVTCANNIIDHAFIGIKCMHGAQNVIISGNNISNFDLWGIEMQAGSSSRPAQPAGENAEARRANATRGNIIANNLFSGFGLGHEYFNWKSSKSGVISLEMGPLPENPVLSDILIQGNVVYDTNRDLPPGVDGAQPSTPNYEYAVFITPAPTPAGLRFSGNLFAPGRSGISNTPIQP